MSDIAITHETFTLTDIDLRLMSQGDLSITGADRQMAQEITRLRTALSEAERRARREALEEAATLAEGSAKTFNFQEALANGDDIEVGAKSVKLSIATAIRALIPSEPHDAEGRECMQPSGEYQKLFEECQTARDEAGFIGSVPDCIRYLDAELASRNQKMEGEWMPIDSAPTDGREFIARVSPKHASFSCFWDGSSFVHYSHGEGNIIYPVTEWKHYEGAIGDAA